MLDRVEVRSPQGALLTLPLEDVSDGLIVDEIEGLDPVKATLVSSSFANADGAQYHSSRRESRNIKFKMGLEPDYIDTSVADLRNRLYAFFMPKMAVNLRFVMDDGFYVEIDGRVEDFNAPLFTKEPEANLSIMCFDPDFIDPNPVTYSGMSTSSSVETLFHYPGTIETGMLLTVRPDRAVSAFTFYFRPPDGSLRTLDFALPLSAGDVLQISTVTGAKGATLTRGTTESSVLYGISPQSNWLEFQPGDNYLRLYLTGADIPFDLEYIPRYGGL